MIRTQWSIEAAALRLMEIARQVCGKA